MKSLSPKKICRGGALTSRTNSGKLGFLRNKGKPNSSLILTLTLQKTQRLLWV